MASQGIPWGEDQGWPPPEGEQEQNESLNRLLLYKPALSESACFTALQGWSLKNYSRWPSSAGRSLCFVDQYKGPTDGISFSGPNAFPIHTIPGSTDYGVSFSQHRFRCKCGTNREEDCPDGACKIFGPRTRVVKVICWKRLSANEAVWMGRDRNIWTRVERKLMKKVLNCFRNESVALYVVVHPNDCTSMTNILGRMCPTECQGSSIPGLQDTSKQDLKQWFEDHEVVSQHQESPRIPPRNQRRRYV